MQNGWIDEVLFIPLGILQFLPYSHTFGMILLLIVLRFNFWRTMALLELPNEQLVVN